jgi:hypothetical protein
LAGQLGWVFISNKLKRDKNGTPSEAILEKLSKKGKRYEKS